MVYISRIYRKLFVFLFLCCLMQNAVSRNVNIDDVYRKQLNIEQKINNIYVDLVARISYSGDVAKAKADINTLYCEKYFESMKDFGYTTVDDKQQLNKNEIFFELRFRQCMALEGLFRYLPASVRTLYFTKYSYELSGYGQHPYKDVWSDISSHNDYIDIIKKNVQSIEMYNIYVCELTRNDADINSCSRERNHSGKMSVPASL